MERWRAPLYEQCCGACGVNDSNNKLQKCGRCHLTTYCSKECQQRAWPQHKAFCKFAAGLNPKGRSFHSLAKHCARALRCFEHLEVSEAELHPLQAQRLAMLREAVEFVQWGMLPPAPYPCFNGLCHNKTELIEYRSELELREFVISGLCAECQDAAFKAAAQFAGEGVAPVGAPDADKGPSVWASNQWRQLVPGVKLRTTTTIWAEGERYEVPLWVPGEIVKVVSAWERLDGGRCFATKQEDRDKAARAQPGDGEVVLANDSGRQITLSASLFRRKAASGSILVGFAVVVSDCRGTFLRGPKIHLGKLFEPKPPLVAYISLTRVPGLDCKRMAIEGPMPAAALDTAAGALLNLMMEDDKRRRDSSFGSFWGRLIPPQRKPCNNLTVEVLRMPPMAS